jgi:hypothetical protein
MPTPWLASRWAIRSNSAQTSAIRPEIIMRSPRADSRSLSITLTTRSGKFARFLAWYAVLLLA